MIKAVVFDLDDTLILERDYIRSGFSIITKKISEDFQIDEDDISKVMNYIFKISSTNVFNSTLDFLGVCYRDSYIKELVNVYRNHHPKIHLTNDSKYIIDYMVNKGYKLGIITDGYKETQRKKVEALNIINLFDHIIITDELGREYWKPHERPYILMKEKLEVEFHEMIYIGDNVLKDFITAKKLGIKTIQVKRNNNIYNNAAGSEAYLPSAKVSDLSELISLLNIM
jgi:putative hydrolase of the HAD superfamily